MKVSGEDFPGGGTPEKFRAPIVIFALFREHLWFRSIRIYINWIFFLYISRTFRRLSPDKTARSPFIQYRVRTCGICTDKSADIGVGSAGFRNALDKYKRGDKSFGKKPLWPDYSECVEKGTLVLNYFFAPSLLSDDSLSIGRKWFFFTISRSNATLFMRSNIVQVIVMCDIFFVVKKMDDLY